MLDKLRTWRSDYKIYFRRTATSPRLANITEKEVIDYSPSLADKMARNTALDTVEEIADEIAEVIQNGEINNFMNGH